MKEQIARIIYEWNTGHLDFYALSPAFKQPYYLIADRIMNDVYPFMVGLKETIEKLKAEMVQGQLRYVDLEGRVARAITRAELERAMADVFRRI